MPKTVFDIGQRIGRLTVIAELPNRRYSVRCDCGSAEKAVYGQNLRRTVSCGCHSLAARAQAARLRCEEIVGTRFGDLVVLEEVGVDRGRLRLVRVHCTGCSAERTVQLSYLRRGRVTCRCSSTQHGDTRKGNRAAEWTCWASMKARCGNPRQKHFKHYGGRGIRVCERWLNSYQDFLADVGRKPSPEHSLDRYPDNDGNYEPGNVRWATASQQQLNRRPLKPRSPEHRAKLSAAQKAHHANRRNSLANRE